MTAPQKFRKGEVAVLLNLDGGRLFKVFKYVGHGKYKEQATFASQQPYSLEVPETQLVKCNDEAQAVALVEVLKAAHEVYKDELYSAQQKRNRVQRQAIMQHNLGVKA